MYVKIQITYAYKQIHLTSVGVSLIENHLLRATIMIQRSTSLRQGIVYPTKGIRFDCLMDPLDYYEKGSSKEYEPLLSMAATWFVGL